MNDTIVAISTSLGKGAISIVRLSGSEAINIVNNCFQGKDLTKVESHTINYGYIHDEGKKIDEVLVSIMLSPKTYTCEDIVEINCHGGVIVTKKILELMIKNGARLAMPGEFTKRAFLNGRIDLIKSEAIKDLIESKTEEASQLAISQIEGNTSNLINSFRQRLINLLSQIEVNIDYPEYYDIEVITKSKLTEEISNLKEELNKIIENSSNGEIVKNGIKVAIVGKPNVGKSSILNKLIGKEKAIVSNIAGTTRDIVEGEIYLDGILLNIVDTAGIRKTDDKIEKIGVEKSLESINIADLILLILNGNETLSSEDEEILNKTSNKKRIIVINKNDLEQRIHLPSKYDNVVYTNTNSIKGIEDLRKKIQELFDFNKLNINDGAILSSSHQIGLIKKAYKNLQDAEKSLNSDLPIDMIEIDLKECFDNLGKITGQTYTEEILDNLFKNFCVGK